MGTRGLFYSLLVSSACLLAACKGTNEKTPAYLRLDSVLLAPGLSQGSAVHEISAINVYVGGEFIGLFEIPCTIPVLQEGSRSVILIPSVRLNGSRNQFSVLRTMKSFDTSLNFTPGSITQAGTPVFRFKTNTEFTWVEDFEDNNSSLIELLSGPGDTAFISAENFVLNGKFRGQTKCMKVQMAAADTAKIIDMASFKSFTGFPTDGSDIMLEFDVKSPLPVQVALIRKNTNGKQYLPYVYIVPTNGEWKRFYINLIYELYNQPAGTEVQLLFSPSKAAGVTGMQEILFDNFRLTHLK